MLYCLNKDQWVVGGGGGFLSTIARIGFNAFAGGGSVPLDAEAVQPRLTVKSPKSVALPVDAIVT